MEIKKVGVVGCGLMGRGIVEIAARAGYEVIVSEINQELLDKGIAAIDASLVKAVKAGKANEEEKAAALKRITGTTNTQDFKSCDLVIEAAIENLELKKKIFTDLDKICPPQTILASNTSVLSVMNIAAVTKRQDKVLGVHFFNPVPLMRLLELVRTIATSDETLNTARAFGEKVGKEVVIAKDTPGFIVNRLGLPLVLEAIRMLESGTATREDIDKAMKLGLNHPMGPFQLADFIGLDTIYFACSAMYDELKNPLVAPPVLLRKMVAAGQYGRKSGKGFYDYKQA
jgi:3-hydroxybutyryl-CoA dehydrogenase